MVDPLEVIAKAIYDYTRYSHPWADLPLGARQRLYPEARAIRKALNDAGFNILFQRPAVTSD